MEATLLSVLDYSDVIYRHAPISNLKHLDAVYHSALRFITYDPYGTHHCVLYQKVGWPSLSVRPDEHFYLSIYKGLLQKLPPHLLSLLCRTYYTYNACSQDWLTMYVPAVNANLRKTAFRCFAPFVKKNLQSRLKHDTVISIGRFS